MINNLILSVKQTTVPTNRFLYHVIERHFLWSKHIQSVDWHTRQVCEDLEERHPELNHIHVEVTSKASKCKFFVNRRHCTGDESHEKDEIKDRNVVSIRRSRHCLCKNQTQHNDCRPRVLK